MTEPQSAGTTGWTPETLKVHVDALFAMLRDGRDIAEQEREKAANALREELARASKESVDALRDHVAQDFKRVDAALASGEKLEVQRISETKALISAVQREITIAFSAAQKAIDKQEENASEWRSGANEWRQQSADRERSQAEELATLSSTFIRQDTAEARFAAVRENLDTQIAEVRRMVQELADKVSKLV